MRRPAVAAALVAFAVSLSAQQQPSDRPVFRSGVTLVRLDVRVVDDAGRPIADLRSDEVEIHEGGTRLPIVLFQHVSGAGGSYVEAAQRTIASDVSTNQGAPQGQLYVLVFDQDHIRPGAEQKVRIAAESFLRRHVRPQDRVAIYGLPGPGPAQPFTANLNAAREQLAQVRGGLTRRATGTIAEMTVHEAYEIVRGNEAVLIRYLTPSPNEPLLGGAGNPLLDLSRRFEDPAILRRLLRENAQQIVTRMDGEARRFLQAFTDLLHGLRGIDGRKTVILFSEGFHADNVARDIEAVAAAAAETYSVIYAFDLNQRAETVTAGALGADEALEVASRLEPLGSLSAETSGDLVKDAYARVDEALGTLQPDDGSYYLLGFEPAGPASNENPYRRVKVHVRRPGVRVLTRTGYAAADAGDTLDRRRAIDTALAAPFTQQGLKIEYTTYVGESAVPGQQRVALSLQAELPVRQPDAARSAPHADVVFVVRDRRTGRAAASGTGEIPLPDRANGAFSTGMAPWRIAFDLPAGDYIMRCVIREPGGIVGSADRKFVVPALGGHGLAATDLLVRSPGDPLPVRPVAYTEGTLAGAARVYASAGAGLERIVAKLELTPLGDVLEPGAVGRISDGVLGDIVTTPRGTYRDVLFSVPLERLHAGPYLARALIRAGNGELVADLRRPVTVVVGAPPAPVAVERRARDVLEGEIARRLAGRPGLAPDIRQALVDLDRERYEDAVTALDALFKLHPDDAELSFVLGWARYGAGDRTGAIASFRNAIRLSPKMLPAYLALAETYLLLGHPELARQVVDSGLREMPDAPELHRLMASLRK